jgi:hypothetical protein
MGIPEGVDEKTGAAIRLRQNTTHGPERNRPLASFVWGTNLSHFETAI